MKYLFAFSFFLSLSFQSKLTAQNLFKSFVFQMPLDEAKQVLDDESKELKIYFPNGFFEIELFSGDRDVIAVIQIKVSGKSRTTCEKIMIQLENIYQHVLLFNKNKTI